jgi:gliding motility-associated-like protein
VNIISLKNKLLFFIVLFVVQTSFSQLSKTHYIPPLTAAKNGSSNPGDQYMYISTPSNTDVSYRIKSVGLSATFDKTGTVSNTNPKSVYLDTGFGQLFIDPVTISIPFTGRGYIVEASDLIYVSVRLNSENSAQAGALVSKGLSGLGTEFRVGSYTNENPGADYLNFASFMATEDNTTVTISDLSTGIKLENYTGTFPITVNLNKGHSYTFATASATNTINRDGLIGTLIQSDKPIVVNCGSANGSFHFGTARDYGIDQIVDASNIGNEYIFVKGNGQNGWENVLLVAHYNNTQIFINGNTIATATINAGEYYLIEGDQYSANGNMFVQTSNNVFAYQGIGATNNEANQGMFFVPPLSCETKGKLDNIANIEAIGSTIYTGGVSIVTKKGATVTINGSPLTSFSTVGPFDVLGKPDYETYKVTGLTGNIAVQCDNELYCAYFNYNGAATSGSFYSGFPSEPEISFDADFVTLGNCIDNITLEAANMDSFESIEWYYDDGSGAGFVATGNTTKTLTPTFAGLSPFSTGTYKLIGLTCTGLQIESIEVPVSICPDDTDIDGIINDLDIDNDNDGILNCIESYGDTPISLVNPTTGNLNVGAYTFNGAITPIGNSTNNFMGASDGSFKSEVFSKNGLAESSVTYKINFNKNLNLLFKLPSSTSLGGGNLNNEQEFIIQVSNNKTITLIDPDDQLLVDTNYDGVYESGVTQFSSFEIRFKIKGSSLAPSAATFEFVSSMINTFSYTHKNLSETNSNTAVFKIKATCLPIDSDNDGITDEFDYDSENDGIPDRVEGTGTLIILTGSDNNNDGLDNVFDINASPLDSDNDGVLDYLDIDSDNDGIFDLEESGSGLIDANFDGIIDNILASIGNNGLDNNAETSPDSGLINYTIQNTDADAIFNYINTDSDGDLCTDVIEAGFTDLNNDGFIDGNGIDLNGKVTSSDGYTLPNNNYLIAGLITIIQQPINTEVCELTSTILTIETNVVDSYQWQLSTDGLNWNNIINDAFYSNSTTNQLTITNIPLSFQNNNYRVVLNKAANSCGLISNEITLTVNALPISNLATDLVECDNLIDGDDTNGIVQNFDLESQTTTILGTQTLANFNVTYHLSQAAADLGENALSSPHENSLSPNTQTIFVRIENKISGCFISNSQFNLIVNPLPTANSVADLVECDNLTDGDDTNGIVQNFDLESQTANILGTQLPSEYTVTYHTSSSDATSGINPLTSPFENSSSPNLQTIYVRVLNNNTGCINTHLTFNVVVNELPLANTVQNIELCDNLDDGNDTNGIVQTFNLESQTATILGGQSSATYQVTYHLSTTDALSGNNPLTSPHSNSANPNSQTIYVRVLNKITNCINTQITFDLIVQPLPIVTNTVTLKQCDDDTDGFSFFNLTQANTKISANAANEIFTYYLSQSDALAKTNKITNQTAFENRTVNSDVVWASIESPFGCSRIAEIQLFVSTTGIPTSYHRTFYQCDDFLDEFGVSNSNNDDRDGFTFFDFSSVDAEIRAIFPVGQQIIITYYRNENDALAEVNAISDISNYRNVGYPNSQEIYVRVDSEIDNDCLGFGAHITLNVEALPYANPVSISRQCDDDADGMFPFDTSAIEPTVIGNQTNVTVSYFDATGNALPSTLPNPFVTANQTITIRVTNNTTMAPDGPCYDETTLEFIVDKSPIAYPVSIAPVCDDESNDGIFSFNTSTIQASILGGQTGMEVHYFDATGNELPSPLPNPFTISSQTVTVKVINPANTNCVAVSTLDFIVNPLPNFNVISPQIICITEPPLEITLKVFQQNAHEVFNYEWTNAAGSILSTNKTLNVANPGTYFVKVSKTDGTLCSRTKSIVVNPSIIATITQNDIEVNDDTDNNTITINTANLGIGDYEFSLDNPYSYQDEPFFDYVEAGIHTLFVRDKNNCGTAQIEVSVIGFPKFFTPNNDGFNDTWTVLGVNKTLYPDAKIYIFDRFGKLIANINPDSDGWDGIFNGEQLPSTDYWFKVELIDTNGNSRIRSGHFSLIRK